MTTITTNSLPLPPSLYAATAMPPLQLPPLDADRNVAVAIVGGGYYWLQGGRYVSIDNAYVRAAKLAVAAMNGNAIDGHKLDVRISEHPNSAKKPAKPRPSAGRPPPRSAPRQNTEDQDSESPFAPQMTPRRQPTFQVERRSLPRRF